MRLPAVQQQNKRLLLLSNSTCAGQNYLDFAAPWVADFFKNASHIVFVPFAAVGFSYATYGEKVKAALPSLAEKITVLSGDEGVLPKETDAIMVGGGNTFALLKKLQETGLIPEIQKRVNNGVLYAGWSAGANLACPTIKTTNDMPVVEPMSFNALHLVDYQINPHFTNLTPPGHNGETREQRLKEFLAANPESQLICLPEGAGLRIENGKTNLVGDSVLHYFVEGTLQTASEFPF